MKKTKFIALALVVAFALSGIAFAAWTDTTLFDVTADTGEFQIALRELEVKNGSEPAGSNEGVPGLFYYGSNARVNGVNDFDGTEADPDLERVFGEDTENAVVDTSTSGGAETVLDDNTMTIYARNLFPGVYAAFGCEIMNNGTVPAALDSVTLKYDSDMSQEDKNEAAYLWVELQLMLADKEGNPIDTVLPVIDCHLKDLPNEIETALADFRFDPSYTINMGAPDFNTVDPNTGNHGSDWGETQIHNKARIGMNEDTHNWKNEVTEDQTYSFDIQYNWKQWNMPQMDSDIDPEEW